MEVALIRDGLRDIAHDVESIPALLVLTAGPVLRSLGFNVPDVPFFPEDRLYERATAERGDGAHSYYNALLRSIVRARRAVEVEHRLRDFYEQIEPRLNRYPAIHPPAFRAAIEAFLARQ